MIAAARLDVLVTRPAWVQRAGGVLAVFPERPYLSPGFRNRQSCRAGMPYCAAYAAIEADDWHQVSDAAVATVAGATPSQRWHAIETALHAHGVFGRAVFLSDSNLDDHVDQGPYGVVALSAFRESFPAAGAELESVFEEHDMAVIDVCACGDDFGDGPFFAWFHPRERLGLLPRPAITSESVARRLRALAERLEERGVVVVEQEQCETAYGPHGRLVLRRTVIFVEEDEGEDDAEEDVDVTADVRNDGGTGVLGIVVVERDSADAFGEEDEEVELVLGRWGWTSSESDLWLLPPSSASTAELDDLVITDMGIAAVESVVEDASGAWAPTWEDVVAAAIAINILAPFVQAFARRTGEDSYQALRKFISNHACSHGRTRLHDPEAETDLVFDPPLPDEAIMQLARIEPARLKKRIAEWDQESGTWKISRKPRRKS